MLTRQFWLGESGAIVRAIRTAAQTAIAAIGVGTTNLFSADLQNIAALAGSAAILSLLMSLDRQTTPSGTVAAAEPAVLEDPTPTLPLPIDPAAADFQPTYLAAPSGCGGDLR